MRFWPTPTGWLLPGGRRVEWLAAGTFDRAVGLSLFTGQLTHRIDANVDLERDHILQTLLGAVGRQRRDRRRASAQLLDRLSPPQRRWRSHHAPTATSPSSICDPCLRPSAQISAAIADDDASAAYRRTVPITVAFAVALMAVRALVGLLSLTSSVPDDGGDLLRLPFIEAMVEAGVSLDLLIAVGRGVLVAYMVAYVVLSVLIYRGHRWARTAACC